MHTHNANWTASDVINHLLFVLLLPSPFTRSLFLSRTHTLSIVIFLILIRLSDLMPQTFTPKQKPKRQQQPKRNPNRSSCTANETTTKSSSIETALVLIYFKYRCQYPLLYGHRDQFPENYMVYVMVLCLAVDNWNHNAIYCLPILFIPA